MTALKNKKIKIQDAKTKITPETDAVFHIFLKKKKKKFHILPRFRV